MFRFTIRDMLWLMIVVGMGCALTMSWHRSLSERQKAAGWRTRAGALEEVLKDAGWKIEWSREWITVRPPDVIGSNGHIAQIRTDFYQPSTE
jgi:hypothetical protein